MNTLQKGALGLARAIYEYQKAGYTVSVPLVDAQEYDLVIEKEGTFSSVQCRYTTHHAKRHDGTEIDNKFMVGLRSIKTNTKETIVKKRGKYDLLFVMCGNEDCYSIPASELPQSAAIVGGEKYMMYKLNTESKLDRRASIVC
jgi:hypothetical protein